MRLFLILALLQIIVACSTLKVPDGYELVESWPNKDKKLFIVAGSNLDLSAKRVFASLIHSALNNKDYERPIWVKNVESYGQELEIWTVSKLDGGDAVYYLEAVDGFYTLKMPPGQNPERGFITRVGTFRVN